jgi:hypothetical protein
LLPCSYGPLPGVGPVGLGIRDSHPSATRSLGDWAGRLGASGVARVQVLPSISRRWSMLGEPRGLLRQGQYPSSRRGLGPGITGLAAARARSFRERESRTGCDLVVGPMLPVCWGRPARWVVSGCRMALPRACPSGVGPDCQMVPRPEVPRMGPCPAVLAGLSGNSLVICPRPWGAPSVLGWPRLCCWGVRGCGPRLKREQATAYATMLHGAEAERDGWVRPRFPERGVGLLPSRWSLCERGPGVVAILDAPRSGAG